MVNKQIRIVVDDPKGIMVMIQKGSRSFYVKTVHQLRSARGLLGWSQAELAARAGLSLPTVKLSKAASALAFGKRPKSKYKKRLKLLELNFSTRMVEVSA